MSAKSVWIVDDDPGILEVTKIVIEEAGFAVKLIDNADDLFSALETEQPQVILLDILLSGADGIEVCKKIKANPQTQAISVIMMSADIQIQEKCSQAGADGCLRKPFDISELEQLVKKFAN